jgi:hypothetical protein
MFKIEIDHLASMRRTREAVAMEAFLSTDLPDLLRNIFPGMVRDLMSFTANFKADDPAIPLNSNQRAFVRKLEAHQYSDLAPLTAFIPEGMQSHYTQYLGSLQVSVKHAVKLMDEVLAPYSLFLSRLITNKDEQFSTQSMESTFQAIAKERDYANETIACDFKVGSTQSETTYGKVVSRNGDWLSVLSIVDQLSTEMNKVDRKALEKKIKECDTYLNIIIDKIKRDDLDGVSPQVVQNLADGAYQVGLELQFFTVTFYKVQAIAECIKRTVVHVEKVLQG